MHKFGKDIFIDGEAYGKEVANNQVKMQRSWTDTATTPHLAPPISRLPGVPGPTQAQLAAEERRKAAQKAKDAADQRSISEITKRRAQDYELRVLELLARVHATTQSGRFLIAALARSPRETRIVPLLGTGRIWNNGSALADDHTGATRYRRWVRNNKGDVMNPRRTGTGIGSGVEVEFITPDLARLLKQAVVPQKFEHPDPKKIANPDEILFHELVHALRMERGVSDNRRVPKQERYGNFEEFFAMTITNIFRSELDRDGVRNDNHGATERSEITDLAFIETEKNRRHLRQFRRDHRQLFTELKSIEVKWNPLRHMALN